jgi:GNAT superfamily N-acetyltransferase
MTEQYLVTKTQEYCAASLYKDCPRIQATAEASLVGTEWWVNRVLVQPESARCKGIGGRLLEALKQAVAEVGGTHLLVTPGGYSNEWERQFKFYRAHGFKDADPCKDGLLSVELKEQG